MEHQNSEYCIRIGKTNFIVCAKQSEAAKKPIDTAFRGICIREVLGAEFSPQNFNLDEISKKY